MLNIKNLGKKAVLSLGLSLALSGVSFAKDYTLLNVSYDPTRELYKEYNAEFSKYYKEKTGDSVKINQSHGGSGSQARSVIDGNAADVVTLALAYDIDAIANADKLKKEWQSSFANDSTPYYSTIVFLVRKGNPKGIKDWSDLVRDDVKVVTPNPKTSGGARWNHLAALGYALKANNGDKDKAREFLIKLYSNVPVLDTGARGATNTFTRRKIGDVLLAWENEAYLALEKLKGQFEIVVPPLSIKAQTPVAVVDSVVDSKGTREVATEYLNYLYTQNAQEIVAKYYYRPSLESVAKKYEDKFPKLELFDISYFGGWDSAQKENFSDGGEFDRIFEKIKAKK